MRIQTWLCMCSCMKNHWTCPWKPSDEQKAKAAEDVSQKFIPKDIVWYLIYAYRPVVIRLITFLSILSTQKVRRSCRLSFVSSTLIPDTLLLNLSTTPETLRNKTNLPGTIRENNPVNHKNNELVLRVFKRISKNLLEEVAVLNTYAEFHNQVQFQIAHPYTDEGGEFKDTFRQFLDKKNICKYVFKKSEGSNQRLAIMETFNRTTRYMLDMQRHVQGDLPLAGFILDVSDLYNRFFNKLGNSAFFCGNLEKAHPGIRTREQRIRRRNSYIFLQCCCCLE